jgi:4-amino-4-deoxychorismate lyase
MCRLFESIRLADGAFHNASLHEARMAKSVKQLFGITITPDLHAISIPEECREGLFKCRLVYREDIEYVEFVPYSVRKICSARIVKADEIDYSHKFLDREVFQKLLDENRDCDELLLTRDGLITDSTYSNLAFFDGIQWFTPTSPLLEGTRRRSLLDAGLIFPREIRANELSQYSLVSFINAMTDLREVILPVTGLLP